MWCAHQSIFQRADKGGAFLACRWHELFDRFSPDTFQPKLLSLAALVSEATQIAALHRSLEAWGKHLDLVRAEIAERLERDIERTMCTPRQLNVLRSICGSEFAAETEGLGRLLELEGFQAHLESQVCSRLKNLDPPAAVCRKRETDMLLTTLATHAFQKGCWIDGYSNVEERICEPASAVVGSILDSIPAAEREYDCILAIEVSDPQSCGAVRAVVARAGATVTSPHIPGLPDGAGLVFLRRNAKGFKSADAVQRFQAEIQADLNLLGFYNQRPAPLIRRDGWIYTAGGRAETVETRASSFRNLHPRRNAQELAAKTAAALQSRKDETAVLAALELQNLALSTDDDRLRLVNLWSALECLGSLVEGNSIMSRVEKLVVPVVSWRKTDKVLRYLAISLHFWLKANPDIERAALPFPVSHNDSVAPERILTILTEVKDSPKILALLSLVSCHPLLLYRIHEAWKIFHNPKVLSGNLRVSANRLRWHLWRIYRARNLLLHRGDEPAFLPQLTDHLQHYFQFTLSRLLHGLTFGSEWRASDSLRFWTVKSDHLKACLHSAPNELVVSDLLPEAKSPDYPVWPASGDAYPQPHD